MGRTAIIDADLVLDAAEAVVAEFGPGGLTFESVSARAGISKGGLQYSFPSKAALIRALLDRRVARLEKAVERALAAEPDAPGAAARAYVGGSLDSPAGPAPAALLAAAAADPRLLSGQREAYRAAHARLVAGGTAPARAAAVMLATDGLLLLDVLGIAPFDAAERAALRAELLDLASPRKDPP